VPTYLATKLRQTDEARESLAANDFETIRRFGHNLKGTGHGYGFPRLGLLGAELEKSAIEHDQRITSEQLEALRQFLVDDAGAVPVETLARQAQDGREKVRL
jgi:HPt (histidine-containing phosphotransfer) domain-containing protein